MKSTFTKNLLAALLALGLATAAHATLVEASFTTGNTTIPDGTPNGLAFTTTLTGLPDDAIADVNFNLQISGGYNGDLYGYLVHNGTTVVLLNRVGVTSTDSFGYANTGFNLTFDDSATGDIHNYQSGSYTLNGSGQLTGTWQVDGRTTDPDSVVATDARTTTLADFNGGSANGSWTLFLVDLSPGAESVINGATLSISIVPEPVAIALGLFAVAAAIFVWRRRAQARAARA